MKLPNGHRAIIDQRKVTDYCLDLAHEDGSHKARLFQALIGLNRPNASLLLDALRDAAETGDAAVGRADKYGRRYVIDFELAGPNGTATVRSAWIIRNDEEFRAWSPAIFGSLPTLDRRLMCPKHET